MSENTQILTLQDRTKRLVASYNIAISDAVATCLNILSTHDHSLPYVLLEKKLIGAMKDLRRKEPNNPLTPEQIRDRAITEEDGLAYVRQQLGTAIEFGIKPDLPIMANNLNKS